jgi:RNA polymerase sigma-70 factor (ECF subfamily)
MKIHKTEQADPGDTLPAAGDGAAWLLEHGDAMYRYARARVRHRDLAEDLVQEALLAALQSRDRFEGQASVRTWLLSILRHKILDHYRRVAQPILTTEVDPGKATDPVRSRYFSAKGLWKSAIASWRSSTAA